MRPIPKPTKTDKKPRKPIKRTAIKPKKRTTGEAEMFRQIWNERPHLCSNCQGDLGRDAKVWFFSHRIRKSRGEQYRLDPANIDLLCMTCHTLWDAKDHDKYNARTGSNRGRYVGGLADHTTRPTNPAGQDQARRYFDIQGQPDQAGQDRMADHRGGGRPDHRAADQLEGQKHHGPYHERNAGIPDSSAETGQAGPVQMKRAPDQQSQSRGPAAASSQEKPEPLDENTNLTGTNNGTR